jgi:hypothetical protein
LYDIMQEIQISTLHRRRSQRLAESTSELKGMPFSIQLITSPPIKLGSHPSAHCVV